MLSQSAELMEKARTARIMYEETKAFARHGGSLERKVNYENDYYVTIQKTTRIEKITARSQAQQLVICFEK